MHVYSIENLAWVSDWYLVPFPIKNAIYFEMDFSHKMEIVLVSYADPMLH